MFQAVLFDLDETLLDRHGSLHSFLQDQYERFGERLSCVPLDRFRGRFVELDQRGYVAKKDVYAQLIQEFGLEGLTMEELLSDYMGGCCHHARPFEGMRETLDSLRARGYKLGIITNGLTDFQQKSLDALGLPALVDTILISQKENLRKPDPRIFELAAERLGVGTEECLFVGDHPRNDIGGAKAVGMKTAWFPNGAVWPDDLEVRVADWKIGRLDEVLEIVS